MPGLTGDLLSWYEARARDLPWRRTRDPYAIWVSEVMLQQTRVETAIPYYHRFLERFPTPRHLAEASVDAVLQSWAGLGYYRRARALWLAAREVTDRHAGRVPDDEASLRRLPGVGPYTAGAVLSIAYGAPLPVVDGNVARVLGRYFALPGDLRSGAGARGVWERARSLVPVDRPGDFNQALMELGATVCVPTAPRCAACPIAGGCEAYRRGEVDRFPARSPKKAPAVVRLFAIVGRDGDAVLLARRRQGGLFGGLWEPPMVEATSRQAARSSFALMGLDLSGVRLAPSGSVRHVLTHRIFEVTVLRASRRLPLSRGAGGEAYDRLRYAPGSGSRLALSTLARRVLAEAEPS